MPTKSISLPIQPRNLCTTAITASWQNFRPYTMQRYFALHTNSKILFSDQINQQKLSIPILRRYFKQLLCSPLTTRFLGVKNCSTSEISNFLTGDTLYELAHNLLCHGIAMIAAILAAFINIIITNNKTHA